MRFFKEFPLQIKATVEGEIKGHHIRCEKTLELGDDHTQVEFLVEKSKAGHGKVIATTALLVKRAETATNVISTKNSYLTIVAERIK